MHKSDPTLTLENLCKNLIKSEEELKIGSQEFDALDVTLGVQIKSLNESEEQFLRLISLLPQ
jgi:hypothetical protein